MRKLLMVEEDEMSKASTPAVIFWLIGLLMTSAGLEILKRLLTQR